MQYRTFFVVGIVIKRGLFGSQQQYEDAERRSGQENQRLTQDFQRTAAAFGNLQAKFARFQESGISRYSEVCSAAECCSGSPWAYRKHRGQHSGLLCMCWLPGNDGNTAPPALQPATLRHILNIERAWMSCAVRHDLHLCRRSDR